MGKVSVNVGSNNGKGPRTFVCPLCGQVLKDALNITKEAWCNNPKKHSKRVKMQERRV